MPEEQVQGQFVAIQYSKMGCFTINTLPLIYSFNSGNFIILFLLQVFLLVKSFYKIEVQFCRSIATLDRNCLLT